jgi:hypothetical protein
LHHFRLVFAVGLALIAFAETAVAEDNIYAPDVRRAERGLEAVQSRLSTAQADLATADAAIPAAEAEATRLTPRASSAERRADRARRNYENQSARVEQRRQHAFDQLVQVGAAHKAGVADWRETRARWVSVSASLIALVAGIALLLLSSALRTGDGAAGRNAASASIALGMCLSAYLCALIAALHWADAWTFSWWPVVAAGFGAVATIGATMLGWRRQEPFTRPATFRAAFAASALALAVLAPASLAAGAERPGAGALSPQTLRLAHLSATAAPMPEPIQAALRHTGVLEARAARLRSRTDRAYEEWDRLDALRRSALRRSETATRHVGVWTRRLAAAQDDYDEYEELLRPLDEYGSGDYGYNDELPEIPDYGGSPTTEDFGNGRGSIGFCNDGTLSDSIGRQGACSHHGGVR